MTWKALRWRVEHVLHCRSRDYVSMSSMYLREQGKIVGRVWYCNHSKVMKRMRGTREISRIVVVRET